MILALPHSKDLLNSLHCLIARKRVAVNRTEPNATLADATLVFGTCLHNRLMVFDGVEPMHAGNINKTFEKKSKYGHKHFKNDEFCHNNRYEFWAPPDLCLPRCVFGDCPCIW